MLIRTNKSLTTLLAILFAVNINAQENSSYFSSVKNFFSSIPGKIDEWALSSLLENENELSADVAQEVREILHELQIPNADEIILKRADKIGNNAYARQLFWGCDSYIIVSEPFYRSLTPQERRFLIGHEAMHLKHKHLPRQTSLYLISQACSIGLLISEHMAIKKYMEENGINSYSIIDGFKTMKDWDYWKLQLQYSLASGAIGLVSVALAFKYSQLCEYEADLESVRNLNCESGALGFFRRTLQDELSLEKLIPFYSFLRKYTTHPATEKRIEQIKTHIDASKTTQDFINDNLFIAIDNDNIEELENAINQGADIHASKEGFPAIVYAAKNDKLKSVTYLIEQGCNPNIFDEFGFFPLFYAARDNHLEMVKNLLDHGAQVDTAYSNGQTALFLPSQYGHIQIMNELINHGANVNAQLSAGITPLHLAICGQNIEAIDLLLETGADLDVLFNGCNIIEFAREINPDVANMLETYQSTIKFQAAFKSQAL